MEPNLSAHFANRITEERCGKIVALGGQRGARDDGVWTHQAEVLLSPLTGSA